MRHNGHVVADLGKGLIAGAVATWLMNQVTTWMYERESEQAMTRENEARGGTTAYENAVDSAADLAGVELSNRQRAVGGTAVHWMTGVGAGAVYAIARRRWPAVTRAGGLPYGIGFFLLMDEFLNPVLGFTPGPLAFPWQTHARGIGGHMAFGVTNELVLDALDRVT
jgi:hypothetical protein